MIRGGKTPSALEPDDRLIFDDGLVLLLKEFHERLDSAVADAYGWPATLSDDEILARLVALNKARAAEEAKGQVRWLRPDYQIPRFGSVKEKAELDLTGGEMHVAQIAAGAKQTFPSDDIAQTAAVMAVLANATAPVDASSIASAFKQGRKSIAKIDAVLSALLRMGYVDTRDGGKTYLLRRAA
jgi:hypothetical protein